MCTGFEALALAAGGLQAASNVQQGRIADAQGKATQRIMDQQAAYRTQVGQQEEDAFRRSQSRVMASRRALMGASGVDAGSGSPLLVTEDLAGETELQALKIRNNASAESLKMTGEGSMARWKGRVEKNNSYIRGGASLLQGAGTGFGKKLDGFKLWP